ncbi:CBS domain-containing protein [Reichenbachiella carrageenanivorans]|uniref:CBS domain-containing protein n=1 Tax=Reichenbachiella carrageenanivorans TaxID=2979869 RepID=A0ABY6CWC3_9BACT|nr:CBS domain-containing protein [Reichenbachiella carrageenanivorans]UXX78216.1 CBS domain-containing protein [Reichenbachiella carrageenanivorans]
MVKNYKGAQITKEDTIETQPVSVSDYMSTRLITFHPDQSIMEVVEQLLKHKISGAPVVNDQKELCGIISEGDCLKEVVKGKYHNHPIMDGKVSDHMAKNVITIHPGLNIFEAAQMFLEKKIRRFPVLDETGKLVGQISQKDIMRAVQNIKSENWR